MGFMEAGIRYFKYAAEAFSVPVTGIETKRKKCGFCDGLGIFPCSQVVLPLYSPLAFHLAMVKT